MLSDMQARAMEKLPWRTWYKTRAWRDLRATQLRQHPLCQCPLCREGAGAITPATVVDHIHPHRGDARLFYDPSNLQSLAKACHDRKTAREDGGFGNRRSPQNPIIGGCDAAGMPLDPHHPWKRGRGRED